MRATVLLVATAIFFAAPAIAAEPNAMPGSVDDPKVQIWIACLDSYVKQSDEEAVSEDQLIDLAVKKCRAEYLAWNGFHLAASEASQANTLMMAFAAMIVHETRFRVQTERLFNETKSEGVRR